MQNNTQLMRARHAVIVYRAGTAAPSTPLVHNDTERNLGPPRPTKTRGEKLPGIASYAAGGFSRASRGLGDPRELGIVGALLVCAAVRAAV